MPSARYQLPGVPSRTPRNPQQTPVSPFPSPAQLPAFNPLPETPSAPSPAPARLPLHPTPTNGTAPVKHFEGESLLEALQRLSGYGEPLSVVINAGPTVSKKGKRKHAYVGSLAYCCGLNPLCIGYLTRTATTMKTKTPPSEECPEALPGLSTQSTTPTSSC